jgi:hypothetical protein
MQKTLTKEDLISRKSWNGKELNLALRIKNLPKNHTLLDVFTEISEWEDDTIEAEKNPYNTCGLIPSLPYNKKQRR